MSAIQQMLAGYGARDPWTWAARETSRNWCGIDSSSDGTKLAAVVFGGQIYTGVYTA